MKTKNRFKTSRGFLLGLVLILLLSVTPLAANGFAKYTRTVTLTGEVQYGGQTVRKLADSFTISTGDVAEFPLIPGTTPAPAPVAQITGKTEIPAYLYIEVVNNGAPETVSVNDNWTKLDGVTGEHGGQVYVYAPGPLTGDPSQPITILQSGELDKTPLETGGTLTVYGYLVEKTDDASAADAFQNHDVLRETADGVTETFVVANADCKVNDDYTVTNTGNIPALIRTAVVLNWVDEAGNIVANAGDLPEPEFAEDWTKDGDYYYYNGVVDPGGTTSAVITANTDAEPAYTLQVMVLAQAIQAEPADAAGEAWHAVYSDSAWSERP